MKKLNVFYYFGNFCIGFINRVCKDNFPLCSRSIAYKKFLNNGLVRLTFIIFSALLQLFTNDEYVSSTVGFEN